MSYQNTQITNNFSSVRKNKGKSLTQRLYFTNPIYLMDALL